MIRDSSFEAEQAVLAALLSDPEAWAAAAEVFHPALFAAVPVHAEIATEIRALALDNRPLDPVLICQRLDARRAEVDHATVYEFARAAGTAGNIGHYLDTLESLWAKREARKLAREVVTSDRDVSGEEFVGQFAERLSAIECRRSRPIRSLAEIAFARLERREEIQKRPELLQVWPTGYGVLDALTGGFRPGHLWTLAARPGVGKTAFVVSMLEHLAQRGVPVGMFVLEDYADAVADRTLMREGGIGSTFMRDTVSWGRETWSRASKAVEKVANWPVYVDDQHGRTIHDIAGTMRRMARDKGVKVFVLDNLSEVAIDRQDRGEERLDRALGRIAKVYRDAANAVGACPVLIVHLNREVEKRQGQPRMSDLKNSGEIEDASHVVAMLSREKDSEVMTVDVVKNRNGPSGSVELAYDRQFMAVRNPRAA